MATEPQDQPSFSPRNKWSIGFNLVLRTVVVLAVVVMVNYLSGRFFYRAFLSSQTRVELSPRTVSVVKSITNEVKVTLYYDKDDPMFSTIAALLNEYRALNPRITIRTVDYLRDPGDAGKVKADYKQLAPAGDKAEKNLVIFDCEGRVRIVPGNMLADYDLERVPNEKEREYRRRPTALKGEMMFTGALLAVTSGKPLKACYLIGHGEHRADSGDEADGYLTFASILQQNYVQVSALRLVGTNTIPSDCNLLIIAGPTDAIPEPELQKISQYLDQGGRLFLLFNFNTKDRPTGLEEILQNRWDVVVGKGVVSDKHSLGNNDVVVAAFDKHPIVNPLLNSQLDFIMPRPIGWRKSKDAGTDVPKVVILTRTEDTAVLVGEPSLRPQSFPLAVAVEKRPPPGVASERGATRMVVVGDSYFLANGPIDLGANRDFAGNAINWLLDRPQLVEGLAPRPWIEHRMTMTKEHFTRVKWILLAAMPGGVLLFGGLVWLSRRK